MFKLIQMQIQKNEVLCGLRMYVYLYVYLITVYKYCLHSKRLQTIISLFNSDG